MGFMDRFRKDHPAPIPDRAPSGAAGRAHTHGFLQYEEFNHKLIHPLGLGEFDKMYRTDGDSRQVVQLVSNPITAGTWSMDPYGGELASKRDQYVAEACRWALFEAMAPNLIGHLQSMVPLLVRSGFTPYEKLWTSMEYTPTEGESTQMVVPRTLSVRLPRTIQQWEQDEFGELTRIKQWLPVSRAKLAAKEGESRPDSGPNRDSPNWVWIDAENLLYYRLGGEGDNWEGVSMLRPAYKHWLMKDRIERIDAIAQEREAVGVPICYPPLGATDGQLDAMEAILDGMRSNEQGYIIAPGPKSGQGAPDGQGWLIEVIGYDRTGSGRDPQPSLKYHTDKIAAAFISEFMRLGHASVGARATAQVQADPFLMSVEALATIIETVLNDGLVKPLVAYNFPDVKNPPRLRMSLVDSTSLSSLADFVLKLTQVGALLPDQELEDFLRARGDLPPANPESVKKRAAEEGGDDQIRRDIVTGAGGNGDAFGANADPAKAHGPKSPKKSTQSGKGDGGGKGIRDDELAADVILSVWDEELNRYFRRPVRDDERHVALGEIDDEFETMPELMEADLSRDILKKARHIGVGNADIRKNIARRLRAHYDSGAAHVRTELEVPNALDRGAVDRGHKGLGQRATAAAKYVEAAMLDAHSNADMIHGDDEQAQVQAAAEQAGRAAARRVGRVHSTAAFLHGRHDAALDSGLNLGVRYVSLLDRNTCKACHDADDGATRSLDDPVRIDRRPPNRHCDSTASGHNMCRCFEVYEPLDSQG